MDNLKLSNMQPDNILVRNAGLHPVINFSFMLRVEGLYDLPCKSVKSLRRENEFEYIQEGGLNDYVHLKRKPISKPFTFQVERYVGVDYLDPLPMGTELILPVILFVNKYCFPTFKPVRTYIFTGCTVTAKDYGDLNSEQSGLLTETTTIAYREMVCLDVPSETLEESAFQMNGKNKGGAGARHYNQSTSNTTEAAKSDMELKAKRWRWGSQDTIAEKSDSGYSSIARLSRREMEKRARRWKLSGSNAWGEMTSAATPKKEAVREALLRKTKRWPPEKSAARVADFLSRY